MFIKINSSTVLNVTNISSIKLEKGYNSTGYNKTYYYLNIGIVGNSEKETCVVDSKEIGEQILDEVLRNRY